MLARPNIALFLPLLLAACASPAAAPKPDAAAADMAPAADSAAAPDSAPAADAVPDAAPAACQFEWFTEKAPADPKRNKFALGLFHFNIEYVIGGLEYTAADGKKVRFLDKPSNAGYDDAKVQDYIIDQTLRPILELYERHPAWGTDIEIQGEAIEVMAARHPKTLALLKKLIDNGQIELISFHWAAQLFLAFPREDLQRSHDALKAAMAHNCIKLGPVVFNQEGQAGEGRQEMLVSGGWKIGVFPKNLWSYQHQNDDGKWWPLYSSEGGLMVVGPGGVDPAAGIDVAWHFFDDGELRAVGTTDFGPKNPYFAPDAPTDPARVQEYEDNLLALDKAGYFITRIGDYVRHLQAKGIAAKPAPPLIDGTWQAPSTGSIHKWLGGQGILAPAVENDSLVRSGNARARMHVAAMERIVAAEKDPANVAKWRPKVDALWRTVWRAEVSDCSGINPWAGEVFFGIQSNQAAIDGSNALLQDALKAHGQPFVDVDLQSGQVTFTATGHPELAPEKAVDAPFAVTVTTERPSQIAWTDAGNGLLRLTVTLGKGADSQYFNDVLLVLPRFAEQIEYSPGLLENQLRTVKLSDLQLSKGEVYLPIANGLVGLGDGWYAIQQTRQVRLAARIKAAAKTVEFHDNTAGQAAQNWVFLFAKTTPAKALDLANRANIWPLVKLPLPPNAP